MEASEIVPPEEDDEDGYTERGVSRDPMATTRMLDQEEKEDAQWIERRSAPPKSREQKEVWGLEVKTPGDG